ncbi:MAG: peptide chain release factor N(5)-glutamine methyltransferase [Microthrixaceae bacterium]
MSTTWRRLQGWAADELRSAGVEGSEREARWMVEEASGHEGEEFLEVVDTEPVDRARGRLESMVARRCGGEPIQYVLGRWAFRGLDLMVDRRVLVPRPETESVVDVALGEVDRLLERVDPAHDVVVVDLGTGSGAIALSVASERVRTRVWATDRSEDALVVATANLGGLGRAAARVRIARGSWFEALDDDLRGRIGVVVSNPPYVDPSAPLPPEVVDWEPHAALFAADGGRADLEVIVTGAGSWLRPDGALVCELSPEQATWALELARGVFGEVGILRDLAGRERILLARHPRR